MTQKAAFNSPVWFNIGVRGVPQQGSACFILAVEDSMKSILNWYTEEGIIFKGGSGAGVNLSRIRSSAEILEGWLNAYREGGRLPNWPSPGNRPCMIGSHSDSIFADAWVKGIRSFNLQDAYARIDDDEVWLFGMHVLPYEFAHTERLDPVRPRKLLLHRREIVQIARATQDHSSELDEVQAEHAEEVRRSTP